MAKNFGRSYFLLISIRNELFMGCVKLPYYICSSFLAKSIENTTKYIPECKGLDLVKNK